MPVNLTGPRNAISVNLAAGGSASLACGLGLASITSIAPAVLDSLFPSGLSVGPAVGRPALSQTHVLAPVGLTVAPTVEAPALSQTYALAPAGLSVAPEVGAPALTSGSAFAVDGLTVEPSTGTPALSQTHALAPAGVQAVPAMGAPALTQTHSLAPTGLTVAPSLGTPSLGGALALTPAGLSMTSALGSPALSQVHALAPGGLTATPTVGAPTVTTGGGAGFGAYAANSITPDVVADFASEKYTTDGSTDIAFADLITLTRGSSATYVNSSGAIITATTDVERIGHHTWNGTSWVNKGFLIEGKSATNLFLNSASLSTQNVTVSATAYTVHFTGTGTITFSGAYSGSLVGTGAGEQNRVSLTFTPSAGTLTCTVSGAVSNAQIEADSLPSSYIPTTGATVTRAAELVEIPTENLAYSATAMSMQIKGVLQYEGGVKEPYKWNVNTTNFFSFSIVNGSVRFFNNTSTGSGDDVLALLGTFATGDNAYNIANRAVSGVEANTARDGTAEVAGAFGDMPINLDAVTIIFDGRGFNRFLNGTVEQFCMWSADIGDVGIEEATA